MPSGGEAPRVCCRSLGPRAMAERRLPLGWGIAPTQRSQRAQNEEVPWRPLGAPTPVSGSLPFVGPGTRAQMDTHIPWA